MFVYVVIVLVTCNPLAGFVLERSSKLAPTTLFQKESASLFRMFMTSQCCYVYSNFKKTPYVLPIQCASSRFTLPFLPFRDLRGLPPFPSHPPRWPAQQKWTFEWMGSTYGNEVMPCSDLAPFFRHCDRGQIRTVSAPLRQFTQSLGRWERS